MQLSDLRPVFFRVLGPAIREGWIRTTCLPNVEIWGEHDTLKDLGFPLDPPNSLGLSRVPQARLALLIGERVRFARDVDLHPLTYVEQGERGVVGRRDRTTGAVEVWLETYHRGLDRWSNALLLQPHGCSPEHLEALETYADAFTAPADLHLTDYIAA